MSPEVNPEVNPDVNTDVWTGRARLAITAA